MPDQILSQDEIDALLSAIRTGEVKLEEEKPLEKGAKPYDLTSQSISLRAQFGALEEIYDRFSTGLRQKLSLFLQRDMEVSLVSREIVKFSEVLKGLVYPAYIDIFSMEPLIGSSIVSTDPALLFSFLDCMFGGKGKTLEKLRPFTFLEMNSLKPITNIILQSFEEAWEEISPIKVVHKKTETKPEFLHIIDPSDYVISVILSADGKDFSGFIHVCMPYLMLEPIREKLTYTYLRTRETESAWNEELRRLLIGAKINVVVELGRAELTLNKIMSLKPNDIIRLDKGPDDPVFVKVQGVPKYLAIPGTHKGNKAVQISSILNPNLNK